MTVKKNISNIISFILFIIFICICFFITYTIIIKEKNPNYKLESYIINLNNLYENLDIDNSTIDDANESLKNITILKKSRKNMNTFLKHNETEAFDNLLNATELYIKQIINIYSTKDNLNEDLASLTMLYDEIVNNLKLLPTNSSLLNKTIDTITTIQNKFDDHFYSKKISSISNINLSNFITNLNSITYSLLPLIDKLETKILDARNNKYNYELILHSLDNNLETIKNLRSQLSTIPIPQKSIDLYHQTEELIDLCEEFTIKLKYSVKNEKLDVDNSLSEEEISKLYEPIDLLYSKLLNDYNLLKHKLDSKLSISTYLFN